MIHFNFELIIVCLLFVISIFCCNIDNCNSIATVRKRAKRSGLPLIYYNASVLQFVCGFGIPVEDLDFESVTSGIVFKSTYSLPSTMLALRQHTTHNLNARNLQQTSENVSTTNSYTENRNYLALFQQLIESKQKTNANYRWILYKALELLAENFGQPGRACVLKCICEAAEVPFQHESGILGELFHILLTPSTSLDEMNDNDYIYAEHLGRTAMKEDCTKVYKECSVSFLKQISQVFDYSSD